MLNPRPCFAVVFLCSIAATAASNPVYAGDGRHRLTLELLNQSIPEVSMQDQPLERVVEFINEIAGVNIIAKWQLLEDSGIKRDAGVTLRAKNVKLSQLLWMLMNEVGGSDVKLAYRAAGNMIIISTETDLSREVVIKVYDISDLLVRVPWFSATPGLDVSQALSSATGTGGNGGFTAPPTEDAADRDKPVGGEANDPDVAAIVKIIRDTIEPDSWRENGGPGTIHVLRGKLIVRNTIAAHQKLGGYLTEGE